MRSSLLVLLGLAASASAFAPVAFTNGNARSRPSTQLHDGKANAIRDRIKTVKNTKKITQAMKLVAAAKVRKAQDAVLLSRPFSETLQSLFGGIINQLGDEPLDLPLLEQRDVKTVTLLAISGDRGLCGGYNAYIIKKTQKRADDLKAKGLNVNLICVGKKVSTYFAKRPAYDVILKAECSQNPTAGAATDIANDLLRRYLSGETDSVELIYTKFVNLINSVPSTRTLLPCSATAICQEDDEIFQLTTKEGKFTTEKVAGGAAEPAEFPSDMIFEQDPVQILNSLLPLYLNGQILRTLQESVASELAARMNSMAAASDNAGQLQKNLETQYNRARQAAVTQELLEIVSGASAVQG